MKEIYTLDYVREADGGCDCGIHLDPGHVIYKAHFPGFPVTPGVCIVGMAVELASALSGRKLSLSEAKDIKFVMPITPKGETVVDFDLSLDGDILKASVKVGEEPCAKMTVTLKEDE